MANDITSREQRIRKEAELQSLYATLTSFRGREASYIQDSAAIPEVLTTQINETRRDIERVEDELIALTGKASEERSRSIYRQAFETELAGDFAKAIKGYKSAGRYGHFDATAAVRSVRYRRKRARTEPAGDARIIIPGNQSRNRVLIGSALLLLLVLLVAFIFNGRSAVEPEQTVGQESGATATPSSVVQVLVPATATSPSADIPTSTPIPIPTNTSVPTPTEPSPTETSTPVPTSSDFTLIPAPKIIDPKNGSVWGDGSIVFEFEKLDLAYDELYCLNTMRGYNLNNAEIWSHEPRGNKRSYIAVEPNVFRVARAQGVSCIVWSAYVAKGSCEFPISESTEERVIGLPRPCEFD